MCLQEEKAALEVAAADAAAAASAGAESLQKQLAETEATLHEAKAAAKTAQAEHAAAAQAKAELDAELKEFVDCQQELERAPAAWLSENLRRPVFFHYGPA